MSVDGSQKPSGSESGVDSSLARNGGLTYLEIPAADAGKSAAFYQAVVGWLCRDDDKTKFSDQTGHLIGRWVTGRAISRQPGLLPYIYVDHIRDVIGKVAPNGGEIVKAPYAEGNLLVAIIRDPAGNILGLWQTNE
jgi:predicted enzyme related to lactoylglutathione lyase